MTLNYQLPVTFPGYILLICLISFWLKTFFLLHLSWHLIGKNYHARTVLENYVLAARFFLYVCFI